MKPRRSIRMTVRDQLAAAALPALLAQAHRYVLTDEWVAHKAYEIAA
jgi:hypothetical protein